MVRADVVDYSLETDTALLRTREHLDGHQLVVATEEAPEGTDIGVLGFTFGVSDVRLSKGTVSSGETQVTYPGAEGFSVDPVLTTDTAVNGGNSGGPAVNRSGEVVGLVSGERNWSGDPTKPVAAQGDNYLVPSTVIRSQHNRWQGAALRAPADCADQGTPPVASSFELNVDIESSSAAAGAIAAALRLHGDSINSGAYSAAWSVFTPRMQTRMGTSVRGAMVWTPPTGPTSTWCG